MNAKKVDAVTALARIKLKFSASAPAMQKSLLKQARPLVIQQRKLQRSTGVFLAVGDDTTDTSAIMDPSIVPHQRRPAHHVPGLFFIPPSRTIVPTLVQ